MTEEELQTHVIAELQNIRSQLDHMEPLLTGPTPWGFVMTWLLELQRYKMAPLIDRVNHMQVSDEYRAKLAAQR